MKKSILLFLVVFMLACFAGCNVEQDKNEAENIDSESKTETSKTDTDKEDQSISVNNAGEKVTITVPSNLLGEDARNTQAEYDAFAKESGYDSATLNDDGSVTYVMSNQKHDEIMQELRNTINSSFNDLKNEEGYEHIESISANNTFTEFSVVVSKEKIGFMDSALTFILRVSGEMYNIFNGTPTDNVAIKFVNSETGETIHEVNTSELENLQ